MSLKSGHRIVPVFGKEQEKQIEDFKGNGVGTIRLQPDGWFLTSPFIEFGDKIFDFEFKPTDVLVMTYPKCGTTWTQEIIWTLRNNPDLNNPLGESPINVRCPFMDVDFLTKGTNFTAFDKGSEIFDIFMKMNPDRDTNDGLFLQLAELSPEPRTIKTHLPFSLLRHDLLDTCKVVYVIREPKDVAVSYHHHSRMMRGHGYVGSLDSFVNHFVNDTLVYSPFWTNAKEAWLKRDHPNVHFIFYEDMKENPKAEIIRLQKFLGTKLDDNQINNIVKYTSFPEMKKRDNLMGEETRADSKNEGFINLEVVKKDGGFFRKGVSGDWKNKLTAQQAKIIDEWTKENVKSFGPDFKYSPKT